MNSTLREVGNACKPGKIPGHKILNPIKFHREVQFDQFLMDDIRRYFSEREGGEIISIRWFLIMGSIINFLFIGEKKASSKGSSPFNGDSSPISSGWRLRKRTKHTPGESWHTS